MRKPIQHPLRLMCAILMTAGFLLTTCACSPAGLLNFLDGCKQSEDSTYTQPNNAQTVVTAADGALGSLKDATGGDVWEDMTDADAKNRYNSGTDVPCNTYAYGQCTWWACMRGRRLGIDVGQYWHHGGQWADSARAAGYTVTQDSPVSGSIVSFPGGVQGASAMYGHVAIVEKVDSKSGMLLISEMNHKGLSIVNSRVLPLKSGANYILPDKSKSLKSNDKTADGSTVQAKDTTGETKVESAAWQCDATSTDERTSTTVNVVDYKGDGIHATPEQAKAIAKKMMQSDYKEWPLESEFAALVWVWEHESGWRWDAENPSSGAYGIPQSLPAIKLAAMGDDWHDNAATQIAWGLAYIKGRYLTPSGAKRFWLENNWY